MDQGLLARRRIYADVGCRCCRRGDAHVLYVQNTVQQNRECSQGIANATAVESHVEAGFSALSRRVAFEERPPLSFPPACLCTDANWLVVSIVSFQ